jgi:transglutaminase/protease-like cytokinesis protein 3
MKNKILAIVLIIMVLAFPVKAYKIDKMNIVFTLHDILMNNLEYDYEYSESSYTLEGSLRTGKAVCQGYALAFSMLLDMTGLENHVIIGVADGGLHSWNCVVIEGTKYYIDLTWNDINDTHYWFKDTELPNHRIMFYLD